MTEAEFIPRQNRLNEVALIGQISNAVFGDNLKAEFTERYVPDRGKVPGSKVQNFSSFLQRMPTCLWALRYQGTVVGFILIGDIPHANSIGFGIDVNYANMGILSEALVQIRKSDCIIYPLYAYTSARNKAAECLLKKSGFIITGEQIFFMGEESSKYVIEEPGNRFSIA